MPGYCSICSHTRREEIDTALIKGKSYRSLSPKFGVALGSLSNHKRKHLAAMLAKAEAEREESAFEQLKGLRVHAHRILKKAELAKDYGTAITCVRELARLVALSDAAAPVKEVGPQHVELTFTRIGMPETRILPALPPSEKPLTDEELREMDVEVDPSDGAALI